MARSIEEITSNLKETFIANETVQSAYELTPGKTYDEQFSNVFAMFMYRMKRLAELSLAHKGRMEQTYEEHMAILDCMKNGDTSHIYEITLKHMETPRDINLEDL